MAIDQPVQSGSSWRAVLSMVFSLIALGLLIFANFGPGEDTFFKVWAVAILFSLLAVAASLSSRASGRFEKFSFIFTFLVGSLHLLLIIFLWTINIFGG